MKFGTDGVRGRAYDEVTLDDVRRLGHAAAQIVGGSSWLIGRDTRESGADLALAFAAGITSAGGTPIDLGVVPTPALASISGVRQYPAAMVTASHNPWWDNGVKVFAAGGRKLADDVEQQIEACWADTPPVSTAAVVRPDDSGLGHYLGTLTGGRESMAGLRVVLDCANGAMSVVAPLAFQRLGADVVVIHDEPDGRNINDQCGATHPASLQRGVTQIGADLGLAFDGDGDRVIAVDHLGAVVDGDRLLAMAALHLRERGELRDDTVVVTVMSNLGFHKAMHAAGIEVVTTAVGDRYVLEQLDANGYSLGGEQSGHIIYRDLATTGDGLLAGVQLAEFVRAHHRPLADLAASVMSSYPQVLLNVRVGERRPDIAALLSTEIAEAEASLNGDGRVLVRASGTEPLVRVMVEAATEELAQRTARSLIDTVRQRFA
jgi:phosphoglucosamine mutase